MTAKTEGDRILVTTMSIKSTLSFHGHVIPWSEAELAAKTALSLLDELGLR